MKIYRITTRWMTAGFVCDDKDIIVESAPILKRFIGQKPNNILAWAKKKDPHTSMMVIGGRI